MDRKRFEEDDAAFPANAYSVDTYKGVAWHVMGWEVAPDDDTEWSGFYVRTGKVVCIMVGDDRLFAFEPERVSALADDAYCRGCGQMGCGAEVSQVG